MKHRNIGTKLQFLYLVKVKIVSVHAVMLQRSVMQVLDEICSSSNNRGVYRNEREIKFGYKKNMICICVHIVSDPFKVYVLYNKMFNLCVHSRTFSL